MVLTRFARRAITLPSVLAWHALVIATVPVALPVAALLGLLLRSSRPLRTVALLAAYSASEVVVLLRIVRLLARTRGRPAGDGDSAAQWQALMRWVLVRARLVIRRTLGVHLRLERGSASREDAAAADGVIVLARHCGPGDSILVAWLLVVHYGFRLRVVLRSLLRVVPSIDLAGEALPFCFVGLRRASARAGVAEMAATMSRGDALLLFPEGRNYSRKRWAAGLRRLEQSREAWRLPRARRNRLTLPPRLGGVTAALEAAPAASVMLVAHNGLAEHGRDRPWWRLPVDHDFTVRTSLLPADRVPHVAAEVPAWLDAAWTQIDTWVEGYHALHAVRDGGGVRLTRS